MDKEEAEKEFVKFKKHIDDNPKIIDNLASVAKEILNLDNPELTETRAFITNMSLKMMQDEELMTKLKKIDDKKGVKNGNG
ncbi:hypothetical protein LCGC14_0371780 [marine sediment metagenome]|uniref:Uncharacterized protein n=1 Tax=marine sediment metagenome TaxID=412755 RepID=A0A0F9VS97_9ZZZZ